MDVQVTTVTVSHLPKARAFYEGILGFELKDEYRPTHWISYQFEGSAHFAIQEKVGFVRNESNDEIDFQCTDIEPFWNKVKDSVKVVEPLKRTEWGSYKFVILDPDGLRLGFVEKPQKSRTRFDMIGIFVEDHKIMVPFYRDVLGLEIDWNGEGPYAEFQHDGIRFSMYGRRELPQLLGQEPEFTKKLNGTFELAINVGKPENVDKKFQEIIRNGGKVVYPPRDEPWKMRSAMLTDPEGNIIEIASDFWK